MPAIMTTPEILFVPISSEEQAVLTVEVETSGVGAVDPPTRRAPTARELERIARSLLARTWKFSSTLD